MSFPLVSTIDIDDDRLRRLVDHLAERPDMKDFLRCVAAERLRVLEALAGISPEDPQLPRLQGRAEGIAWMIGLFNRTDDEE